MSVVVVPNCHLNLLTLKHARVPFPCNLPRNRLDALQPYVEKLMVGRLVGSPMEHPHVLKPGKISAVPYAEPSPWQNFKCVSNFRDCKG